MDKYELARWLAENHETISPLLNTYPASEQEKLKSLARLVVKECGLSYEETHILFEDDKVRLIIDRYYLKELH